MWPTSISPGSARSSVLFLPGLVAVTAMNMYSGGLSTLTTVDTVKRIRPTFTARWISIGFITVAGTVLALSLSPHFLTNFNNYLFLILYFMIPWTAVDLIDFFYVRKGNYAIRELFIPNGMYGMWSWRGLVAYGIAFAAMIPFMSTTIAKVAIAKHLSGGDISPFIGFPIAAGLYYLFSRSIDVAAEARVAAEQKDLLEAEAMAHEEIGEEPASMSAPALPTSSRAAGSSDTRTCDGAPADLRAAGLPLECHPDFRLATTRRLLASGQSTDAGDRPSRNTRFELPVRRQSERCAVVSVSKCGFVTTASLENAVAAHQEGALDCPGSLELIADFARHPR